MNILAISNLYPNPLTPTYGIFIHRQVKQLQKLGHQVTVFSPIPWSPKPLHFKAKWLNYSLVPIKTTWDGVEVYYPRYLRLPGAWFRALAGLTAFRSIAALAYNLHRQEKFEVIHSSFIFPNGVAGLYLGRKLGLPTVCSVLGNDILTEPFENFINQYYAKMVIERTNQIVTQSRALEELVNQFAKPAKPAKAVTYGVDTEKCQSLSMETISNNLPELQAIKPFLLFVGHDIRRKGLKDLLIAFNTLVDTVDYSLVIIGPSFQEVHVLEPELVDSLKDRLFLTGPVFYDDLASYMKSCHIFVLPSYEEGLPNAVLEAMACEKPVIATNITGIPEAVLNNITGILVQPGSPAQLAEAIKFLINNPERSREMGKRGREHVLKQFSWEHHTSEIVSVYKRVITEQVSRYAPG